MRRLVISAIALAAVVLGLGLARSKQHADEPAGDRVSARQTGVFRDNRLTESSGAAVSRSQPGTLWTLNDSGNEPRIFATDSAGTRRWSYLVEHASNIDWEALALGPCGTATCLFIADIGDNGAVRDHVTIYRITEPRVQAGSGDTTVVLFDSLAVRYADGAHDAEAFVVNPAGDAFIITKGREGAAWMYQIPATQWGAREPLRARQLGEMAIETSLVGGRLITDASLSPEGDRLAVRTYRTVYIFSQTAKSRWLPDQPKRTCDVGGLEPQGEGIGWWDRQTVVLTSEGRFAQAGTIFMLTC